MRVKDAMTAVVYSVRTDTPFKRVVELMEEREVSGLPVTDGEGHVVGVVTEGDLVVKEHRAHHVKLRVPFVATSVRNEQDRRAKGSVAGELMSAPAITVDQDDELRFAARVLSMHGIKRLPVTKEGQLVGILSRRDVLRVFLRPDADVRRDVEEILKHKILEETPFVDIAVSDGVVTLRGSVVLHSTCRVIAYHADRLDGVTRVDNELRYELDDLEHPKTPPPAVGPLEQVL